VVWCGGVVVWCVVDGGWRLAAGGWWLVAGVDSHHLGVPPGMNELRGTTNLSSTDRDDRHGLKAQFGLGMKSQAQSASSKHWLEVEYITRRE